MSMFSDAKAVPTPKKGKAAPAITAITAGIARYSAVDALIKNLNGIKTSLKAEIEAVALERFVSEGFKAQARPANYHGTEATSVKIKTDDGHEEKLFEATASIQLKAVSSSTSLSDEAAQQLTKAGVTVLEQVEVVDTFVINPAYATDMAILAKIEAALKNVGGIPDDLFMKQDGQTKKVLGDQSIDQIFKRDDRNEIKTLLGLATTIAFKPTINADDIDDLLDIAQI